jgi:hypothetical protein
MTSVSLRARSRGTRAAGECRSSLALVAPPRPPMACGAIWALRHPSTTADPRAARARGPRATSWLFRRRSVFVQSSPARTAELR